MNIYFTASIHAKQTDPTIDESYRSIVAKLNELGYKVESDHVLNFDQEFMETIDDEHRVRFYRKVLEMINKADIVIAEMTYASASIGHEVSVALEKNKPVLILCRKGHIPNVYPALKDKYNLSIVEYKNDLELTGLLGEELLGLKEGEDIRFNFLIPASMVDYLEWVSRNRRIPKSVFLRDLIKHEIEKDDEYLNR